MTAFLVNFVQWLTGYHLPKACQGFNMFWNIVKDLTFGIDNVLSDRQKRSLVLDTIGLMPLWNFLFCWHFLGDYKTADFGTIVDSKTDNGEKDILELTYICHQQDSQNLLELVTSTVWEDCRTIHSKFTAYKKIFVKLIALISGQKMRTKTMICSYRCSNIRNQNNAKKGEVVAKLFATTIEFSDEGNIHKWSLKNSWFLL